MHAERLASHRACAPTDAPYVELACRTRPSVLPRWHQDDRGPLNTSRGHRTYAPEGAYSTVPVWVNREHWLTYVLPVALAFHADTLRGRVSPDLMRRYLTVRSGYAWAATGRRCIVRPSTIASVLQTTTRTVQLCQRLARQIGLEVVIQTGRMLTLHECLAARRRGSRQRGLSTEVAFTIPPSIPRQLWINTPTSGTHLPANQDSRNPPLTPKRAARGQRKATASPRQPRRKRINPSIARRLALDMTRALPWLATEHPRRLAPALTRFVSCSTPWTTDDLVSALTDNALRTGHRSPLQDQAVRTRPAVLLAAMLRDLDELNDYPGPAFIVGPSLSAVCERPYCDGWINTLDRAGDLLSATPCADPSHRRSHHDQGENLDADENPF